MSPRDEKTRDFRNAGHCCRSNCGMCRPDKRWHRKERRQKMERSAEGRLSVLVPGAVR